MKPTELPALAELRESLREAAARDIAARKPRRRRRRGIGLLAAFVVTGAAAAGAADLISSGEPVPEQPADPRYQPAVPPQIDAIAHDTPLPWGVQVFESAEGRTCALAGQIRGASLGKVDAAGVFHAYPDKRSGACGTLTNKQGGFISFTFGADRTAVYGRVRAGASSVTVVVDGKRVPTTPGPGGGFVVVFKGRVLPSDWSVKG
jgi:hypothetical protein